MQKKEQNLVKKTLENEKKQTSEEKKTCEEKRRKKTP